MPDVTIFGNAILDVLVSPVDKSMFDNEATSVNRVKLSCGGDALNESTILSRLGKTVELIAKIGDDEAGVKVVEFLKQNGIDTSKIIVDSTTDTSINLVMIKPNGDRFFLTDPNSSQRRLTEADVASRLENSGSIIGFASMFVSSLLDIPAMEKLFKKIKSAPGKILTVDMVQEKTGITLQDLVPLLRYVDYFMPNNEEIASLTGTKDILCNAELLIEAGCGCAIIKCGKDGCFIKTKAEDHYIPAYPTCHCIDTTGAGDSFAAGFIWALSERRDVVDCGCFASAVASCAIEQIGATDGVRSIETIFERYKTIKDSIKAR